MNLERAILTVLDQRDGIPANDVVLLADVDMLTGQGYTLSPLRKALLGLETARQVVSTAHPDRGTLYKITAEGRLRLLE